MKQLKYLVIHCTATPRNREVTVEDIKKWHLSAPPVGRGWSQVGYSSIIHLNGKIDNMVSYNEDNWVQSGEITNGATGYNSCSRHIVYAGGLSADGKKPEDTLTEQQKETLEVYIKMFLQNHPNAKVIGHNQISNKACPSFNVNKKFGYLIPEKNLILEK